MARTVRITLVDDLNGTEIVEGEGRTVTFALNGTEYEMDLTNKNAEALEKALGKYVEKARKVGKVSAARRGSQAGRGNLSVVRDANKPDPKVVRAWATENGIEVPARGRIPNDVVEKFQAAQAS
jgi:hypothetical protein